MLAPAGEADQSLERAKRGEEDLLQGLVVCGRCAGLWHVCSPGLLTVSPAKRSTVHAGSSPPRLTLCSMTRKANVALPAKSSGSAQDDLRVFSGRRSTLQVLRW